MRLGRSVSSKKNKFPFNGVKNCEKDDAALYAKRFVCEVYVMVDRKEKSVIGSTDGTAQ